MKRFMILLLTVCLILSGCSFGGEWIKEPVTFYYVRENYQKDMDQVLSSEVREAAGHRDDLPYLLALYSMGPSNDGLLSLLPKNTSIIPTERTNYSIALTLSENTQNMTDTDFTLASACIAMTCMDLMEIQQVKVISGDRSITIREDNLMLNNSIVKKPQEETK